MWILKSVTSYIVGQPAPSSSAPSQPVQVRFGRCDVTRSRLICVFNVLSILQEPGPMDWSDENSSSASSKFSNQAKKRPSSPSSWFWLSCLL